MSGTITVKPADGARVRQPDRGNLPIPPEGAVVADNSYYRRAILTGDLIEVLDEAAAEDPALSEAAADAPRGRRRSATNPEQE